MVYEVVHNRVKCVGCGACVAACPAYWSMGSDGKSDLKDAKPLKDGFTRAEFKDGLNCNKAAMNVCPVRIISVKELD